MRQYLDFMCHVHEYGTEKTGRTGLYEVVEIRLSVNR